MIVFEDVDPNRVYIMGYSAGGDAAYQIPARAADRWAGAAMSAGHPNGVRPDNYAALAFLIQLGARDGAYNRNKVAAEYGMKLNALQAAQTPLTSAQWRPVIWPSSSQRWRTTRVLLRSCRQESLALMENGIAPVMATTPIPPREQLLCLPCTQICRPHLASNFSYAKSNS